MGNEQTSSRDLDRVLRTTLQGDVISFGGISILGRGDAEQGLSLGVNPATNAAWSVMIESEQNLYVVASQDCDIVRNPSVEPCLAVAPLIFVDEEQWTQLRRSPYSPRKFPFPSLEARLQNDGLRPVVDIRWITNIVKSALLEDSIETWHPLNAPQRERFGAWIGRRFARAAHPDKVQDDVLRPMGACLQAEIKTAYRKFQDNRPTAAHRLLLSIDEWFIGGSEQLVAFYAVTSAASCFQYGLANGDGDFDEKRIDSGRKWLEKKLRSKLPAVAGYGCKLEIATLDALTAAEYRALSEWTFDGDDPLG